MDSQNDKCVMVIDENLPLGIIANTAAVLGITLGKQHQIIKELRSRLYTEEFQQLTVVDFSDVAQSCNDYEDFTQKIGRTDEENLQYFGIAMYGNKKQVNKLTGSMGLLR